METIIPKQTEKAKKYVKKYYVVSSMAWDTKEEAKRYIDFLYNNERLDEKAKIFEITEDCKIIEVKKLHFEEKTLKDMI